MATKVLITGVTGFVGPHAVNSVLESFPDSATVLAVVRTQSSFDALLDIRPEWKGRVEAVTVPDFAAEGAFDSVFKENDIDYVVHVAAPMVAASNSDWEKDWKRPSIEGNLQLLKSAKLYGKNVKAISVTGSVNAVSTGDPTDLKSRELTGKEWLPLTETDAINYNNEFISYCVSKKLAEQAIWDFVETEKPSFHVTVFLPPLIYGAPLHVIKSTTTLNYSNHCIYSYFNGSNEVIPATTFPGYIDVRDLTDLHVKALTTPAAANQRYIVGFPMGNQTIADALNTLPEIKGRVAKDSGETPVLARLVTKPVEEAIPIKYRTLTETMKDLTDAILEWEAKSNKI